MNVQFVRNSTRETRMSDKRIVISERGIKILSLGILLNPINAT